MPCKTPTLTRKPPRVGVLGFFFDYLGPLSFEALAFGIVGSSMSEAKNSAPSGPLCLHLRSPMVECVLFCALRMFGMPVQRIPIIARSPDPLGTMRPLAWRTANTKHKINHSRGPRTQAHGPSPLGQCVRWCPLGAGIFS